jgi:hypothetical protein
MVVKGNLHANGQKLAAYLITGKKGERAELVELRGFASSGIRDVFIDVHIQADEIRQCEKPFFHSYIRLPEGEGLFREQWKHVADRIEKQLGFDGQGRAIAFHHQPGGNTHMHIVWSRIDLEQRRARDPGLYKNKLKEISRQLECELGLTRISSERLSGSKARAPGREEFEQARRLGTDVAHIREAIRACWDTADNGRSFMAVLTMHGLVLARGERRDFVVVDHAGGLHALSKRITGATAAQIRTRLADLDPAALPSVGQAKEQQAKNPEPDDTHLPVAGGKVARLDPVTLSSSSEMVNSIGISPRSSASNAPAIIITMRPATGAVERPEVAVAPEVPERQGAASAATVSVPAARKSWKLAARKLVQREPAAPKPRRRRRGDVRGTFGAAAKMTIRQAVELMGVVRTGSFLSDTLDWLNLWDNNAGHVNDELHHSPDTHLSLRL